MNKVRVESKQLVFPTPSHQLALQGAVPRGFGGRRFGRNARGRTNREALKRTCSVSCGLRRGQQPRARCSAQRIAAPARRGATRGASPECNSKAGPLHGRCSASGLDVCLWTHHVSQMPSSGAWLDVHRQPGVQIDAKPGTNVLDMLPRPGVPAGATAPQSGTPCHARQPREPKSKTERIS
jgi:hypothetical protein